MDCNNNTQYEYQAQVTDVSTLSPSIVNEARVSTIRAFGTWYSPNQGQGYPAKLGLLSPAADAFPSITVDGTVATSSAAVYQLCLDSPATLPPTR